ncbi:MAG: cell wall hydrolase [Lachnospira sp.]|nr:cell wall hydrolase [Lachnospira sp.]
MKRSNHIKTITNRILTILLIFCLLLSGNYMTPIYAVTQSDLDKTNAELEELKKQQTALSSDFANLTAQLEAASRKMSEYDTKINAKLTEIDALEEEILNLSDSINSQYESMKLRIKHSYEQSSTNMLNVLLEADSFADFLSKTEYILQMSIYDRNMMSSLQDDLSNQKNKQAAMETELDSLYALKAQSKAESDNIKKLMSGTQSKINASSEDLKKLEELALAYEKAIEEQKQAQAQNPIPDVTINRGSGSVDNYDETDLAMLAAIIECEAGNQPYEGLIAVGSVVVNRVKDPRFPDTIEGVLFAQGQFTPVASGRFAIVYSRGAMSRCYKAAQEVLNGTINTNALYFHRYKPEKNEKGTIIGDHIFMYSLH